MRPSSRAPRDRERVLARGDRLRAPSCGATGGAFARRPTCTSSMSSRARERAGEPDGVAADAASRRPCGSRAGRASGGASQQRCGSRARCRGDMPSGPTGRRDRSSGRTTRGTPARRGPPARPSHRGGARPRRRLEQHAPTRGRACDGTTRCPRSRGRSPRPSAPRPRSPSGARASPRRSPSRPASSRAGSLGECLALPANRCARRQKRRPRCAPASGSARTSWPAARRRR